MVTLLSFLFGIETAKKRKISYSSSEVEKITY